MMPFAASILVKVTATLALALLGTWLARRSRAASRHVLLAAAFAVLLILPIASVVAPSISVAVPIAHQEDLTTAIVEPIAEQASPDAPAVAGVTAAAAPAVPRSTWPSWLSVPTLIVAAWAFGATVFLLPVIAGLLQVRSLRRSGLPWRDGDAIAGGLAVDAGIRRQVDVLLSESTAGPMTCGIARPAIVLPVDARTWEDEDLRRAIVHELEHVRRGDWASQALARILCALYWFHPLVWVAWRQLALDAERACDDAVLDRAEATAYADQLVALAQRLSTASHQPLLAMANRHDLAARVGAVLDSRQPRGRAGARWIGVASAACALIVTAISPLRIVAAPQSTPATSAQTFEVASIKPCTAQHPPPTGAGGRSAGPGRPTTSPGRAYWHCVTLDQLINTAYAGVDNRLLNNFVQEQSDGPRLVRGGPSWIYSDMFTIEAKAADAADRSTLLGPMLRALLEERFKVKTHRATEERTLYALSVAKGGPKIKPTAPGDCWVHDNESQPLPPPGAENLPACGNLNMNWNGGNRLLVSTGVLVPNFLTGILSPLVGRYVLNKTGLEGRFNIPLEFAPDDDTPGGLSGLAWSRREGATPATGPSIFQALEALGLKLEPTKAPAEYLVIDRVERLGVPVSAQAPADTQKFDVVSIKPCENEPVTPPGQRSSQGGFPNSSPGRFFIECGTVERLISTAYVQNGDPLTNQAARIGDVQWLKDVPGWVRSEKFTIEAKAQGTPDKAVMLGPMLRALLEDRFKLKIHRATDEAPIYEMTLAKGGLKIQPIGKDGCTALDPDNPPGRDSFGVTDTKPICGVMSMMNGNGLSRWGIGGTTLEHFAGTLSTFMDRHVTDKTATAGEFNIRLEFARDEHVTGPDKRPRAGLPDAPSTPAEPSTIDGPTIFMALEQQLGLKLESAKAPHGFLVIDHVERPSPNSGPGIFQAPAREKAAGAGRASR